MNIKINEKLKQLRAIKGVTQEALADHLGVTPQAISRWESGSGYPAIDYLPDIADYFEISVDELLGVKTTEREARREDIYMTIEHIEECGYNTSAIDLLREAHEEFPSDQKISLALAKALISTKDEDAPNKTYLHEAEKILRYLIRHTDELDFRFTCTKELAILYKEAWKDEDGYKETLDMLPGIDSCKEIFFTDYFNGATQDQTMMNKCTLSILQKTVNILRDHVAYSLPNTKRSWNDKLSHFDWLIDICEHAEKLIAGDGSVILEANKAILYRYKATYLIAQGKKTDTLTALESMCNCLENLCRETLSAGIPGAPHNTAWYFLPYLDQDRYDPIRENKRFVKLKERLSTLAV